MSKKTMTPAPICHLDIPAPDLEKAAAFYGSVFGWTTQSLGDYVLFSAGAGELGGGFTPMRPVQPPGIVIYLKVQDIPATLKAVKKAGGAVIRKKTEISAEYGFFATFADPNGNHIGLWSKA